MSLFHNLLKDEEKLFRLSLIFSLVPIILSLFDRLISPIFLALLVSLLLVLHRRIGNTFKQLKNMDPIYRMSALFGLFGFFFVTWFIWVVFIQKPNIIINTILAVLLYLSWNNTIWSKLDSFPYRPIFKGDIDAFDINRSFDATIIPFTISGALSVIIILLDSLIESQSQDLIAVASLRWLILPVIVGIHSILHELFVQQVDWQPIGGITSYQHIDEPEPPISLEATDITTYMQKIEQTAPHPQFFEFLDQNLPQLVQKFRTLEYTAALHSIVRIYSYWGERATDHIHYLHLFVSSSLSRFRALGIVPLYNRIMFYSYLELLYKLNVLPADWYSILEYEVAEKKDDHHRLDWIVKIPYSVEVHDRLKWFSLWNMKIYKGKSGYKRIRDDISEKSLDFDKLEGWQADIWELVFAYLKIFVGPEARESLVGQLSLDEALDFLARKQRLQDFQSDRERRKHDLENPKDRLVVTTADETDKSVSARQLLSYLDTDSYTTGTEPKSPSLLTEVKMILFSGRGFFFKMGVLLVLLAINVVLLKIVGNLFDFRVLQITLVIELVITQFFSVTPGLEGPSERAQKNADVQSNRQFGLKEIDDGMNVTSGTSLVYSFMLVFAYFIFLS